MKKWIRGFASYSLEMIKTVVIAIILGILVDYCAERIAKIFKLNDYGLIVIQIFLVLIVLYVVQINEKNLFTTGMRNHNYVFFGTIFFVSQSNLLELLSRIYKKIVHTNI